MEVNMRNYLSIVETCDLGGDLIFGLLRSAIHINTQVLLDVVCVGDDVLFVDDALVSKGKIEIRAHGACRREMPDIFHGMRPFPGSRGTLDTEVKIVTDLANGELRRQQRAVELEGGSEGSGGHVEVASGAAVFHTLEGACRHGLN